MIEVFYCRAMHLIDSKYYDLIQNIIQNDSKYYSILWSWTVRSSAKHWWNLFQDISFECIIYHYVLYSLSDGMMSCFITILFCWCMVCRFSVLEIICLQFKIVDFVRYDTFILWALVFALDYINGMRLKKRKLRK